MQENKNFWFKWRTDMRALIVDDSKAMRMILKRSLELLGFRAEEADNGFSALSALDQMFRPDLILVDWNMPEMNGLDFVRRIRSKPEYGPTCLLVVTSESQSERISQILKAGANGFLIKPFTPDMLKEKLKVL